MTTIEPEAFTVPAPSGREAEGTARSRAASERQEPAQSTGAAPAFHEAAATCCWPWLVDRK